MNLQKESLDITRVLYESGGEDLEGLIFKPPGTGLFPGVVFLHGHGGSAWDVSLLGYFLKEAGFAAFLPSLLGYGLSSGQSDFNGPKTVKGVVDGIKFFLQEDFVDSERVGIWGVSRGATVAALAATQEPNLFRAAVFQAGAYDMRKNYETTKVEGIREIIEKEAGLSDKAFRIRSPIYQIEKLACPVLILHGEQDDRISVEEARTLDTKLNDLGKPHQTVIFPEADHFITRLARKKYIFPFLEEHLK